MKQLIFLLTLTTNFLAQTQSLKGTLRQHAKQQITLTGYNYYESHELSKTTLDSLGNFTLNYPKNYKGMAVLNTQDNSNSILVLTGQPIQLTGNHLKEPTTIVFKNSKENTNFTTYAKAQGLYGNALSALRYLDNLYQKEAFFSSHKEIKKAIQKEQEYIQKNDASFVASFNTDSYIKWFIPFRKLVQEMPFIASNETTRIPDAIQQFRSIDFNHSNFKTSGLFKELIEGHYMLLENMGQPLDSVYSQMNISTQYLIDNLKTNESLLNSVSNNMFNYFEKRSLFDASAHLSVSLLNDNQCILNDDLAAKLESYRKMKVGKTAPEIVLEGNKKLSDIKAHKLVVFGASWCPHCTEEFPKLENYSKIWKDNKVELIYISIDTNKKDYQETYLDKPWQSYCDYKGWDTQSALDYFVSGTPTYFLLDATNKILLRPKSLEHANVWMKSRGLVN